MDESEYRSTYQAVNQCRCVFEKALNSRRCTCSRSERFYLADREGVGCTRREDQQRCTELLDLMREQSRFALRMTHIGGPLPHNKEIKVQIGGLLGLQAALYPERAGAAEVTDIGGLIDEAIARWGGLDALPFTDIVQRVVAFKGRQRHRPAH